MIVSEEIWGQVPAAENGWKICVTIEDGEGTATKINIKKDEEERTIYVTIS